MLFQDGCAVSAGTAGLAIVLLLNSSPPMTEWVGGWQPVNGESVGIVLTGDGPGLGMASLASLLTLAALAYSMLALFLVVRRYVRLVA